MTFLPPDYKEPEAPSKYLKMKEPGEYRLRVLDNPMLAYVGWTQVTEAQKKQGAKPAPVRSLGNDPAFWAERKVDPDKVRFVWILPVWNYAAQAVQVWEIHQKSIRDPIKALSQKPSWGHPSKYDLAVTRVGTGMDDTEWSVLAEPPSPMPAEVTEAWEKVKDDGFDLSRLLEGGDPFDVVPF